MRRLTVLFDATCTFCLRCRVWLAKQPSYLELVFLPAQSPEVERRFPGLRRSGAVEELIAIDDAGGVYRGESAFLICLYALTDYRAWSLRLAQPALRPLARAAFAMLSASRGFLSRWLGDADDELAAHIRDEYEHLQAAGTAPDACELPPRAG